MEGHPVTDEFAVLRNELQMQPFTSISEGSQIVGSQPIRPKNPAALAYANAGP